MGRAADRLTDHGLTLLLRARRCGQVFPRISWSTRRRASWIDNGVLGTAEAAKELLRAVFLLLGLCRLQLGRRGAHLSVHHVLLGKALARLVGLVGLIGLPHGQIGEALGLAIRRLCTLRMWPSQ